MNTPTKLGAYALGLAALFAGAVAVGDFAGPAAPTKSGEHSSDHRPATGGYQIVTRAAPGEDFAFTVNGPDGRPVTRFTTIHGKKLHLIVVRKDLSGFQHLHPVQKDGGVWSIPLTLPDPGGYRLYTDVQPEGEAEQLTLSTDVTAPGTYEPKQLPAAEQVAEVDGYEVKLNGALVPGKTSKLTLSVSKDGKPVSNLDPYLEAYGHLVAIRGQDLAYLHVHPDGEPGDGKTSPGPDITFYAEVPSAGTYRLYLDFQHEGKVRTAEFTAAADPAASPTEAPTEHGDDHRH